MPDSRRDVHAQQHDERLAQHFVQAIERVVDRRAVDTLRRQAQLVEQVDAVPAEVRGHIADQLSLIHI